MEYFTLDGVEYFTLVSWTMKVRCPVTQNKDDENALLIERITESMKPHFDGIAAELQKHSIDGVVLSLQIILHNVRPPR